MVLLWPFALLYAVCSSSRMVASIVSVYWHQKLLSYVIGVHDDGTWDAVLAECLISISMVVGGVRQQRGSSVSIIDQQVCWRDLYRFCADCETWVIIDGWCRKFSTGKGLYVRYRMYQCVYVSVAVCSMNQCIYVSEYCLLLGTGTKSSTSFLGGNIDDHLSFEQHANQIRSRVRPKTPNTASLASDLSWYMLVRCATQWRQLSDWLAWKNLSRKIICPERHSYEERLSSLIITRPARHISRQIMCCYTRIVGNPAHYNKLLQHILSTPRRQPD